MEVLDNRKNQESEDSWFQAVDKQLSTAFFFRIF